MTSAQVLFSYVGVHLLPKMEASVVVQADHQCGALTDSMSRVVKQLWAGLTKNVILVLNFGLVT